MRQVEAAVHRMDHGRADKPGERIREIVDVAVDHIELGRAIEHLRQLEQMRRQRSHRPRIEAQRALTGLTRSPRAFRVAAGEQRDLMTPPHKLVGQPRHDPLGAAVQQRRHSLVEWRHLRNPEHGRELNLPERYSIRCVSKRHASGFNVTQRSGTRLNARVNSPYRSTTRCCSRMV